MQKIIVDHQERIVRRVRGLTITRVPNNVFDIENTILITVGWLGDSPI